MSEAPPAAGNDLEITPREVQRLRAGSPAAGDMLLIDCRKPEEWELCRLEGALHVPLQELSMHIDSLREHQDRPIVVYCRTGKRSLNMTVVLRELGFTNVKSMAGGLHRWSDEIDSSVPKY